MISLIQVDAQTFWPTGSGFLFANPIAEEFSIPRSKIDFAIDKAVQEAAEQGFHGHRNTPFILSRIKELTEGGSIAANRALIESNIRLAAQVAIEFSKLSSADHEQNEEAYRRLNRKQHVERLNQKPVQSE